MGALLTLLAATATLALPPEPGLLFRASFDGTVQADSLAGAGGPTGLTGPGRPQFGAGRFGQGLLCGPGLDLVHYRTAGHLLPRSGTVSLWVKPLNWTPDDGNFHSFFESGTLDGGTGWLILYKYYQSSWLLFRYADERGQVGMPTGTLKWQAGIWHHLAATWSPEAQRLWVDGELVAEAPTPRVAETLGETFTVGDNGWHLPHAGAQTLLDEVRVYGQPLSAEQIRRLAGRGSLTVRRDAIEDRWHLRLALPADMGVQSVRCEVQPAAGGAPVRVVEGKIEAGVATASWPVGDLAPGAYQVVARVLAADGAVLLEERQPARRLAQERLTLANEHLRLVFDGSSGGVLALDAPRLKLSCRAPEAPGPLLAMNAVRFVDHVRFYQPKDVAHWLADEVALQRIEVARVAGGQRLTAEYLLGQVVKATASVDLPDGAATATFRLAIDNQRPLRPSEAWRLPSVEYPRLTALRVGDAPEATRLASGHIQGWVQTNPGHSLPPERTLQYPGTACVPWQDLSGANGGLALLPLTDGNGQLEVLAGAENKLTWLGTRWWALMEPGDRWQTPPVELMVHAGAWHAAADRFRQWALQATPPRRQPDWLADCDGWLGLGGPEYRFADLPKVLEAARYYGFDYLQLWAQMILGGTYYSWFYPNPDLGTVAELKQGLAEVHRQGGRVGFYSNVITFDGAVDQNPALRERLAKAGVKDHPPLPRFYDDLPTHIFAGPGGAFGRGGAAGHSHSGYPDGYWAMCPGSPWWRDYLAGWIRRWHDEYGADVWYLDSFPIHGYGLGPASYALHLDHPRPLGELQIGLLKHLRRGFDGPLLYEGVACAAFMPYTNWCLGTELSFGSGPGSRPEIFAYSFGDVYPVFSGSCNTWAGIGRIFADLAPARPEDALNYVFVLGERIDTLGLYPLRRDSQYGAHVKRLVALRSKVRDLLNGGRRYDQLGLSGMPDKVVARVLTRAEPAGAVVALWDRRPARQPWTLRVDTGQLPWPAGLTSVRLLKLDGSEQPLTPRRDGSAVTVTIDPSEVAAVRFQR